MYYPETKEQTHEFFRMALTEMGKHNVALNPMNYTLWYEYVSGRNHALKVEIETRVQDEKPFTPEVSYHLFKTHILEAVQLKNEKVLQNIRRIMAQVTSQMTEASGEISQREGNLEGFSNTLLADVDDAALRKIAEGILSETKAIIQSNHVIKDQLESSTSELDTLRKQLGKLREEAITDPLTGLPNRRAFEEGIKKAEELAKAGPLSMLILDIDFFKKINDTYGHVVGDNVLKILAQMLKNYVRGNDVVARFGGEEFIFLLFDTPLKGALALAEKIRASVEKLQLKKKETGEGIGKVTISLGASQYRSGEPATEFIERADKALYHSKNGGRNRVTSETELAA